MCVVANSIQIHTERTAISSVLNESLKRMDDQPQVVSDRQQVSPHEVDTSEA